MNRISKFEAVGIFASIAVMVLVLLVVRDGGIPQNSPEQIEDEKPASVVMVNQNTDNQTQALAEALLSATAGTDLKKLVVNDVQKGAGTEVKDGDVVSVHYIGTLPSGEQFDSSYDRGTPFEFTVGAGRVIKGWDEGLLGMQVGGQRILIIPSDMGYGSRGAGQIPPDATLVFAIELLAIK